MNSFNQKIEYNLFKKTLKLLLITITLLLSTKSIAKEKVFTVGDSKLSMLYPKDWQYAYNFLSTPLTLFGPVENEMRPVISVVNTDVTGFSFDKKKLSSNQEEYKKGRLKWLKKNKGSFVRFSGYRVQKWNNIKEVHSIGYSYTLAKELYLEKTYFFNCNETLFNITTLMTWDQNKKHGKEIKRILKSLNCLE